MCNDTARLYRCIMHDFHDGIERQDMWEKEINILVNEKLQKIIDDNEIEVISYANNNGGYTMLSEPKKAIFIDVLEKKEVK